MTQSFRISRADASSSMLMQPSFSVDSYLYSMFKTLRNACHIHTLLAETELPTYFGAVLVHMYPYTKAMPSGTIQGLVFCRGQFDTQTAGVRTDQSLLQRQITVTQLIVGIHVYIIRYNVCINTKNCRSILVMLITNIKIAVWA